jgi:ATP-binding cassette subfamily B protein/ATP-binding cassette subfamily C protein
VTGFHSPPPRTATAPVTLEDRVRELRSAFGQVPGTFALIWRAHRAGAIALAVLTALAAVLPAAIAWVGKLIVDAVVAARRAQAGDGGVTELVLLELALMAASMTVGRLLGLQRELLRARLGNVVNEKILEKALELELRHFEDADVYDKMQNARREASARPLSLVMQAFSIAQNTITLGALSALLARLSPWSVLVVVASSIPAFLAEARLAAASFRLNSWRAPEGRRLNYLEWILTRDSHVKEVKLFGLGSLVLGRYRALFAKFYDGPPPGGAADDARGPVRARLAGGVLHHVCPRRLPRRPRRDLAR